MSDPKGSRRRVFVVGSFVVACCAKVARFPRPGETLNAASFKVEAGGKGLNLAVAARRLGADVEGILAAGEDIFAHFAEQALARADLPREMLVRYPTDTACGVGFTDASGENCIAVYEGANGSVSRSDIERRRAMIEASDVVLAQFEAPDGAIRSAFAIARAAGVTTVLNPSPCRDLVPELLASTRILVMNESEAHHFAQAVGPRAATDSWLARVADDLLSRGPDLVVVTLGDRGALAFARDRAPVRQPAWPVAVEDTIGCGDAFTAGLAVGIVEERPLPECLSRAAACGALVASRLGVFDALPDRAALEAFLARAPAPAASQPEPLPAVGA